MEPNNEEKETLYNATVVVVQNARTVVINRGQDHSVEKGHRFVVYELGEEIIDPATKKSLGRLEVFKGTGVVIHVQKHMATIETDRLLPTRRIQDSDLSAPERTMLKAQQQLRAQKDPYQVISPTDFQPFDNPNVGDRARLISFY